MALSDITKDGRNQPWSRDELILALELYSMHLARAAERILDSASLI
jgi:hypothetical protein